MKCHIYVTLVMKREDGWPNANQGEELVIDRWMYQEELLEAVVVASAVVVVKVCAFPPPFMTTSGEDSVGISSMTTRSNGSSLPPGAGCEKSATFRVTSFDY